MKKILVITLLMVCSAMSFAQTLPTPTKSTTYFEAALGIEVASFLFFTERYN